MESIFKMNKQLIDELLSAMERDAENAVMLELTLTNWLAQFGESGIVQTPIGVVKMGENQYNKIIKKGREKEFGMIRPTLTNPDVVIEIPSLSKKEIPVERPSCLLFVKTFNYKRKRVKFYTSVTVSKNAMEVVISNHIENLPRMRGFLRSGNLLYQRTDLVPGAGVSD